jgi:hypothetical protein
MAHFARVNTSNIVVRVDAVNNSVMLDENGVEQESLGIAHQNSVYGDVSPDRWIQTSYNTDEGKYYNGDGTLGDQSKAFRKNFAGPGSTWDESRNAFIKPKPFFDSWVLNDETCGWEAPVALPPQDQLVNKEVHWDEAKLKWVARDIQTFVNYNWNSTTLSWEEKT